MVDIALVQSICSVLDSLLIEYGDKIKTLKEDDQKLAYENFFVFAGMWGIGGGVGGGQEDEKDLKDFNSLWKSLAKNSKIPEAGLCYDYFYDVIEQKWQSWNT
jgi:dynein heavy chain, axonemal